MKTASVICLKRSEGNRGIGTWGAFCGVIVLAILSSGSAAQGVIFNVATDFSATNNPNGVWSYGWSSTLTSSLNLYRENGKINPNANLDYWFDRERMYAYTPNVVHNGTASVINTQTVRLQPGQFTLSPGYSGNFSHARWTAPYSGSFDIASVFTGVDIGHGTTTDVHVLYNGTSLFDGAVNGYGNTASFSRTLSMGPGDMIDFVVGYGSNHDYQYDTTALAATITVPEPMTLGLLGVGGLFLRRRIA